MSRKNKRGKQKKRKTVSKKFTAGDSVKVKSGVMCPDDDSFSIAGWQGRVFEIDEDEDLVGIRWDSATLEQMPAPYIEESAREGLDWSEIYLRTGDVEPATPRDSEADADSMREGLQDRYCWVGEEEEDKRIFAVIGDVDEKNEFDIWAEHLSEELTFPFDAEVAEYQARGPLDEEDMVRVQRLGGVDERLGVLADITFNEKHLVFPLCDLEVLDRKSPNRLPVKDYCVWFANR